MQKSNFNSSKLNVSVKKISQQKLTNKTREKIIKILKEAVISFSDVDHSIISAKLENAGFIPQVLIISENTSELYYELPKVYQYVKDVISDYTFIVGGKEKSYFNIFDAFLKRYQNIPLGFNKSSSK